MHTVGQSVELTTHLFCSVGFKNPSPNMHSWHNNQCLFTPIAEMQRSNYGPDLRNSAVLNIEFCSLLKHLIIQQMHKYIIRRYN